jgi:type IV pilus assembly protein PilC
MIYKYTAYTPQKTIVRGILDVVSQKEAIATLERSGLNILSLKRSGRLNLERILPFLYTVKPGDIVMFSRQLAMLLERGVGFLVALRLSKDQVANRTLKKVLDDIAGEVEGGSTFADAVARYPRIFPLTFSQMMRVGEQSGKLETVLREVAAHIEQDEVIRKKIRSASVYPGLIFLMGIATATVLITTVLPSLINLFSQFSTELPWPTRVTVAIATFLEEYWIWLLAAILAITVAFFWSSRYKTGKYYLEKTLQKIPIAGHIGFLRSMYQFSRISAIMLGAGLSITEVISVARESVSSELIRRELDKIPAILIQGQSLSQAMKASTLFPTMLVQMVITGEETNTMESSFTALADHYDFEFDQTMNTFMAVLEPTLVLIIGLIVGFIAVSTMMPIYSIYDVMA